MQTRTLTAAFSALLAAIWLMLPIPASQSAASMAADLPAGALQTLLADPFLAHDLSVQLPTGFTTLEAGASAFAG